MEPKVSRASRPPLLPFFLPPPSKAHTACMHVARTRYPCPELYAIHASPNHQLQGPLQAQVTPAPQIRNTIGSSKPLRPYRHKYCRIHLNGYTSKHRLDLVELPTLCHTFAAASNLETAGRGICGPARQFPSTCHGLPHSQFCVFYTNLAKTTTHAAPCTTTHTALAIRR